MTVTANPTTYLQMRKDAAAAYLIQHHFFTSILFKDYWFPLDSEATFDGVCKTVINALAALGPIDWTAIGNVADLTTPNATRDGIVKTVIGVEYPGIPTVSGFLITAHEFVSGLILGRIATQLATGNYGTNATQMYAQVQIWQQQANTLG